jgi:hypothetical protein
MRFPLLSALRLHKRTEPVAVTRVTYTTHFADPQKMERRQAPRRWGDPLEVFVSDGGAPVEPGRAWVKNRSPRGLGLSVAEPVAEGSRLCVRPTLAPDGTPWVLLEVKHCHPLAGRWMLGCQFTEPPPDDVLVLFG